MSALRRNVRALAVSFGLALLSGYLFGCAGVVAVVRGSHEFQLERPRLAAHNVLSSGHRGLPATTERLLEAFGEPDEVAMLGDDREQWRYRTGLRLHGVALLLVVVPLPLLLPTGFHDTYVEAEHGTVVRARGSGNADLVRVGCMVGAIPALSGADGCFARRGKPPHQARVGSGLVWLGPPPVLRRAP